MDMGPVSLAGGRVFVCGSVGLVAPRGGATEVTAPRPWVGAGKACRAVPTCLGARGTARPATTHPHPHYDSRLRVLSPSSGGDSTAPYVRHSGRRHPAGSDRTVAKATTDPTTSTPAHTVIARPNALSNAVGDRYASSPIPVTSGSAATAIRPAARAAALLMPLASPAREASTEPSTVAVSGATRVTMPAPRTSSAGRMSARYEAPGPTRSISSIPAAHSSGPTVSGMRGPIRSARAPERAENSSIRALVGSRAVPAWRAE